MWNSATITAVAGSVAAIATAVIAIIHSLQHARSSQAHNGTAPPGQAGNYRP